MLSAYRPARLGELPALNRADRATLDRIQQELEKALWSLRQFLDQVDAEHTVEDEVQTCLEHTEQGTNGKQ